jgi:exodeoxyribonuclease V alpha subunit
MLSEQKTSRLLDKQFGMWVADNFSAHLKSVADKDALRRVAEAVSYASWLKHSCLDLEIYVGLKDKVLDNLLAKINTDTICSMVTAYVKPLVCSTDGKKIWLQKYHGFEKSLAEELLCLRNEKRLRIITGGPGTGKTWAAAQEIQYHKQDPDIRILLAAPTGKAANNMMAALAKSKSKTEKPASAIKAKTLHSLLGINRNSPKPRHHRHNPLQADMLIIDEASMIDLPMMHHVLQALPPQAKLLLLGDKDQLASVEAGSVLHEISAASVFVDCIDSRTESIRYKASPEIGVLAMALNAGMVPDMCSNIHVLRYTLATEDLWSPPWLDKVLGHFKMLEKKIPLQSPELILAEQAEFQILCALREGPQGVKGINGMIAKALGHKIDDWYEGRPLMITQNDHNRKLYNGDVGMVLKVLGELKACFITDGHLKAISRAQLPAHETCYALTIHKSQGSEYGHVLVILPADLAAARNNPVLTRELVYTAVTRAKKSIDLWCGEGVLEMVVAKNLQRMSGLGEFLR